MVTFVNIGHICPLQGRLEVITRRFGGTQVDTAGPASAAICCTLPVLCSSMAWVQKLPSGRWRGLYRDASGKQKSAGTFDYKASAHKAAQKAEGVARHLPEVTTKLTVSEWLPRWKAQRAVEESTARQDDSKMRHHVLPRWGAVVLPEITSEGVQVWANGLRSDGFSPSTVQKIVRLLSSILQSAVSAGVLSKNVARGTKLPKDVPSPERFLSREEAEAIRSVLKDLISSSSTCSLARGCVGAKQSDCTGTMLILIKTPYELLGPSTELRSFSSRRRHTLQGSYPLARRCAAGSQIVWTPKVMERQLISNTGICQSLATGWCCRTR